MTDVLIDLGDLDPDDRPPPEPDGPPWTRPSPGQVRAGLAVIVLALAALVIGPAAPALPGRFAGPVRLPGSGAEQFVLSGDVVVVHSGNDQRLIGYGVDGRLRWAAFPPFPRAVPVLPVGDVMLVTAQSWPGQVAALDLGTGEVRWTGDGLFYSLADDTVVLARGPVDSPSLGGVRDLAGIDPATGRERWRAELPRLRAGERAVDVIGDNGILVGRGRSGPDGTAGILDFATGRWRTITGVPPAPPAPNPADQRDEAGFQVGRRSGDVMVLFSVDGVPDGTANPAEHGRMVAYGPDSASPLWTMETATWSPALSCGPWICVPDGDTTRVLDPVAGTEIRRVGWPHVITGDSRRLLGYDSAGAVATTQVAVFDAATGRVLRQHLGWDLVTHEYADWLPLVRRLRGLTWELATLSTESGNAYPLGTFEAAGERACQSTATHVACSVRSGEILIWRHAPA